MRLPHRVGGERVDAARSSRPSSRTSELHCLDRRSYGRSWVSCFSPSFQRNRVSPEFRQNTALEHLRERNDHHSALPQPSHTGVCEKEHSFFARASSLRNSGRNLSPAPGLAFFKLSVPRYARTRVRGTVSGFLRKANGRKRCSTNTDRQPVLFLQKFPKEYPETSGSLRENVI